MLAKASNDLSTPTRKDSCRSNSCGSACLRCVSANRHSVLSCRRSPTRPTTGLHSCAWPRPSLHSSLACAVPPKRLVSLSASESYGFWLKTFWWGKIPSPFVTASRSPRVRRQTGAHSQKAQITFCVRGVFSPLLANVYLHYSFDLWVNVWRQKWAQGEVVVVRYADDTIAGFQYQTDADRFLVNLRERLAKFGLELHPDKTRRIEFGRFAEENRKRRGEGKPETFNFLGFQHISGKNRLGRFTVRRTTIRKRMRAKLRELKQQLRMHMHDPVPETGRWLKSVVQGYFNYYAVPGNLDSLASFRKRVRALWWHTLRRRSQQRHMSWTRMMVLGERWFPQPCVLHPYPAVRFAASHPR